MPKVLKKRKKAKKLEQIHRELFAPMEPPAPNFPQESTPPANSQLMIVTVTSYGAYQAPIEGWSTLNAELGRGFK